MFCFFHGKINDSSKLGNFFAVHEHTCFHNTLKESNTHAKVGPFSFAQQNRWQYAHLSVYVYVVRTCIAF